VNNNARCSNSQVLYRQDNCHNQTRSVLIPQNEKFEIIIACPKELNYFQHRQLLNK